MIPKYKTILKENKLPIISSNNISGILQKIHECNFDEIDREKEVFYTVHLNSRNKITLIEVVSIGTLTSSLVHPREVFRRAVTNGTAKIIISHNHPSGEVDPSDDDIKITKRLIEAGKIIGIELLDHIVFNHLDKDYYSFKDKKLIK